MINNVGERVLNIANYIIQEDATVREIASVFKVSKSTVHIDLTRRLYREDKILYSKVRKILDKHRDEATSRATQASILSRQIG